MVSRRGVFCQQLTRHRLLRSHPYGISWSMTPTAIQPAGYSKRSLLDKLGIKSGQRLHSAEAPEGYDATRWPLPEGLQWSAQLRGPFDFIQFFTDRRSQLERRFPALKKALKKDGMFVGVLAEEGLRRGHGCDRGCCA